MTIAVFVALATGCLAGGEVGYSVSATAPAPELEYVSPGVQVIADYDYPVFFSDGLYWRYDGGVWYRSRTYNGGWAVTYNVPVGVRRIDRPGAYAHYRVNHGNRGNAIARGHEHQTVRDHRHH